MGEGTGGACHRRTRGFVSYTCNVCLIQKDIIKQDLCNSIILKCNMLAHSR